MQGLRVVQVVPSISEEASGPSYSVRRLAESVAQQGHDVSLVALDWAQMASPPSFLRVFPLGLGPRRLGRSPQMHRWLKEQVDLGAVQVIHNHGMWQFNSLYPGWVTRGRAVRYVVSPRGAFSDWAFSHGSRVKPLFWRWLQFPALRGASLFHATSHEELLDIRRLGFTQPVAVIPNGIDIPPAGVRSSAGLRTLLFLGRIHPKKGLDLLLPAWRGLQRRFPHWQLRIVGDDAGFHAASGYLAHVKEHARELGLERLVFSGALRGEQKWQAYRDADLYVLPTYSENFGMTVAEALAAGTPAVCTQGAPWSGLPEQNAGRWVDITVPALEHALAELMVLESPALEAMGQRGREWMDRNFGWPALGQQMANVYEWLAGARSLQPTCVVRD
jgi:glycosyltransferase involved in cell wall biosynthesis